ncbi:cellulose synthase complex periplasmic endoglucanase BcsZ [Ideonella sp.]|uniref:cellulose synthase complex periplasmic endoglucanase BcsZ n=1 Tax=Ideonella sp. TaxID=1929293 RepID=UPI003BB51054
MSLGGTVLPHGAAGQRRAVLRGAALVAWSALGLSACAEPAVAVPAAGGLAPATALAPWPLWRQFIERCIQADGRVVDASVPEQHATSEGQSYAMFFALVANDRPAFEQIWQWTLANLAPQGLDRQLPAWRWGRKPDGSWGVLDPNAASDADLWLAYDLLEAERLWGEPRFGVQARQLLARVRQDEVVQVPGLGTMLLPGPQGFAQPAGTWRFNPSYSVLPLFYRLAEAEPDGPWRDLAVNSVRMAEACSPKGLLPDWLQFRSGDGFVDDAEHGDLGSYDAIRCYLWAGLGPQGDALNTRLLRCVGGLATALRNTGSVPEKVRTNSGLATGQGPAGFHAALLPCLASLGETALQAREQAQFDPLIGAQRDRPERPWRYYDQVLALFALGHVEGRYRFSAQGQLQRRAR